MTSIVEINPTTSAQVAQPDKILTILKPHQRMLIWHCLDMEQNGIMVNMHDVKCSIINTDFIDVDDSECQIKFKSKFGLICDIVGSGKTLTALSIITYPISRLGADYTKYNHPLSYKMALIIVPHTILNQWKNFILNETSLSMFHYYGRNKNIVLSDILLLSNSQYAPMRNQYPTLAFTRVIVDEISSITIPKYTTAPALFCWYMTATYQRLIRMNQLFGSNFRSPIYYPILQTHSGILRHLMVKNNDEFIAESFNVPDYNHTRISYKKSVLTTVLSNFVSEHVQSMIYAGDIEGAIKTFDVAISSSNNLISVVCQDIINKITDKKAELEVIKVQKYSSERMKQTAIGNAEKCIAKLETSLADIEKKIRESNVDPITYCEIERPVVMKCCKTVFDFESITLYATTRTNALCPICRTPITNDNMVLQSDDMEDKQAVDIRFVSENYTKTENVEHLFNDVIANDAHVIMFSEYDASLKCLQSLGIPFKKVSGTSATINKTVQWFNEHDETRKVLFMNAKYCGAGLNLQVCTDLIIYHDMDQDLITQIIGRAQRYGRTQALNIYSFND